MAVNISCYCTRTSVWNLRSQKWKVLQLRVLFLVFFFHKKRADLGCLICCHEMFSFCNTSLILTSAAPAAEEAGQDAGSLPGALAPGWARAIPRMDWHRGCNSHGWWRLHCSQGPSTFTWHQKTCPCKKITLLLHTSYCSSLLLKSSPTQTRSEPELTYWLTFGVTPFWFSLRNFRFRVHPLWILSITAKLHMCSFPELPSELSCKWVQAHP